MSTFIHREISKTMMNKEEIYVCMYVHEEVLVNLSFFKKTEVGFEEMLRQDVPAEVGKELVRKVRNNEVDKVTPIEAKIFNQSLEKYHFFISREIKEVMNKTVKDMKVEYIGEIAGMNYMVTKTKQIDVQQIHMLQKPGMNSGFEIGSVPAPFIEMMLLDYVHHEKIGETPRYFRLDENQYVGLKKSKNESSIIYVVRIDVFPDEVSASKAYMISKKNNFEYALLSIPESTPELMNGLQTEGKNIINQFVKKMGMI